MPFMEKKNKIPYLPRRKNGALGRGHWVIPEHFLFLYLMILQDLWLQVSTSSKAFCTSAAVDYC